MPPWLKGFMAELTAATGAEKAPPKPKVTAALPVGPIGPRRLPKRIDGIRIAPRPTAPFRTATRRGTPMPSAIHLPAHDPSGGINVAREVT